MANTLETSQKYLDLILELFKKGSVTARLDSESMQYDNADARIVKVLKVRTTGLGDYSKSSGYPVGSITTAWEPFELTVDRGAKFLLDRIDDDEVLGLTIGKAAQVFTDYHMIPELDAYRLNRYYSGAGKKQTETLTTPNIMSAIDAAATYLNEKDVPENGRILYVNQNLENLIRAALPRQWGSDAVVNTRITGYNGMEIVYVPSKRMQTIIELKSGANDEWGFEAAAASKAINFILLEPKSVVQASKTAKGKFISADTNPNLDSNEFHFRVFHDAFVIQELKDGVYASVAA